MKNATNLAYGCIFSNPYATFSSMAINSSTASIGHSFWCPGNKNLSELGLRISAKTGTINYGEIQVSIYPVDTITGYPDLTNLLGTTTITSNGAYSFSGLTYSRFVFSPSIALNANTQYCFLYRNLNTTPASNYFSVDYSALTRLIDSSLATNQIQECRLSSTNNTTWTRGAYGGNWFVTFDDNTSIGLPIQYIPSQSFGQNSLSIITPNNRIVMNGFRTLLARSGTYTNTTILRLSKDGNTIADSTNYYNFNQYSTTATPTPFYFDNVLLEPNTSYMVSRIYTSGTSNGVNIGSFGNLFQCTDFRTLRKQYTGDLNAGYPNGDTSDLSRFVPFTIFGDIDNPVYPRTIIT